MVLALSAGSAANAEMVAWRATGTITSTDPFGTPPFSISVGEEFVLTAFFETDTADLAPGNGYGDYSNATTFMHFSAPGGIAFWRVNYNGSMSVFDDVWSPTEGTRDTVFLNGGNLLGGDRLAAYSFAQIALTGARVPGPIGPDVPPLSSDAMVISPDLDDWAQATMRLEFGPHADAVAYGARGDITSITLLTDVTPVPLPAASWLLLSGLGALYRIRRSLASRT